MGDVTQTEIELRMEELLTTWPFDEAAEQAFKNFLHSLPPHEKVYAMAYGAKLAGAELKARLVRHVTQTWPGERSRRPGGSDSASK
jgi:hypothetical protein